MRRSKPVVMRSIEDETGQRCVDIRREVDGLFAWVECRRDPEDANGWRFLGPVRYGFPDEAAATEAARGAVDWMEP